MSTIYWNKLAHDRLWHFVKAVKTEIGGFGYCTVDEHGDVTVHDLFLVPQYASSGEVDFIEGSGVAAAVEIAAANGWLDRDDFMWLSWHSHNTMKVFWSNTDESCIDYYGTQGISRLLSVVGNHSGEYKMRLDFFGIEHAGMYIPQVTTDDLKMFKNPADPEWPSEDTIHPWDAEVAAAIVEKPKPQPKQLPAGGAPYKGGYKKNGKPQVWINGHGWADRGDEAQIRKELSWMTMGRNAYLGLISHKVTLFDITSDEINAAMDYAATIEGGDEKIDAVFEEASEMDNTATGQFSDPDLAEIAAQIAGQRGEDDYESE